MKVQCISNSGMNLLKNTLEAGYSQNVLFKDLEIYKEYIVYSISIELDAVFYLILTQENQPKWYPAELFIITNHLLPMIYYFNFFGYDKAPCAIWGYKEIALNTDHYVNLIEDKEEALKIFFERKSEIDEFENLFYSQHF